MPRIDREARIIGSNFRSAFIKNLEEFAVPAVKEYLISIYIEKLVNVVTNRNSKTKPEDYLEDYTQALDKFKFINGNSHTVSFSVPDINNFNFSGRLRVIKHIIEGTAGVYAEVNGEDYEKITGKKLINEDPIDTYVPKKEQIYLVPYHKAARKSRELGKKFVRFPFSNHPAIDIFGEAWDYYINDIKPIVIFNSKKEANL